MNKYLILLVVAEAYENKENTKRKLIYAVGEIFKTEGPSGLGVNKVARIAGVNKKLFYRYFTSLKSWSKHISLKLIIGWYLLKNVQQMI